jgi:membrane-associated phospholipid phosphatase
MVLLPAMAHAESAVEPRAQRSLWRDSWPTFSWIEGTATVAGGAVTLVLALQTPPSQARWEGGILFDDALRDAMRLDSANARQRVRSLGDLPYYAAPAIPLIIDPLIVAWAVQGDPKTAVNIAFMGLEAFSYTGMLSFVSTRTSLRERPDSSECRRQHPDGVGCEADTESFWSGHTSIAAASAGLVCANHRYLALWGHPVADALACVWAASGALASGVSRLGADRHYATDVIVGLGVGFGIGYGVPVLLHYSRSKAAVAVSIVPCAGSCVNVTGSF